jgi:hypothetical protein
MWMKTLFRANFRTKMTAALIGLAGVTGLLVGFAPNAGASYVQDCKDNSIIRCGAGTASSFISKTRANAPGDLPAVYADFGMVSSEYSRFVSTARPGVVYRDGRIVVDGQVVATNAWSIGRSYKSYSWKKSIAGHTYYASYTRDNLLSRSLPIMAMFNNKGQLEFAVMNACGNPTTGNLVTPKYSCDLLQKTAVSGQKDTYSFTTKASASSNAKVVKLVYDFGDGTTATTTSTSKAVTHKYSKPGSYTATVTVYVSLPGKQTVTVTSAKCKTVITVVQPKQPFQECVQLTGVLISKDDHSYRFTVTTSQGNGSTLKSASFNFGDGNSSLNVAPASPTTVVTEHAFAEQKDYTITASVTFSNAAGVVSDNCETTISVQAAPVCEFNPNLPPESPECQPPCVYNNQLPANSPECKKPEVLPSTGAGSVIGLFLGTSLAGGLSYRWLLGRRTQRG